MKGKSLAAWAYLYNGTEALATELYAIFGWE